MMKCKKSYVKLLLKKEMQIKKKNQMFQFICYQNKLSEETTELKPLIQQSVWIQKT